MRGGQTVARARGEGRQGAKDTAEQGGRKAEAKGRRSATKDGPQREDPMDSLRERLAERLGASRRTIRM